MPTALCDFCSDPAPMWMFPAAMFDVAADGRTTVWRSVGPWAACATCVDLITSGQRDALAVHGVTAIRARNPRLARATIAATDEAVHMAHAGFWASRLPGPPIPIVQGVPR